MNKNNRKSYLIAGIIVLVILILLLIFFAVRCSKDANPETSFTSTQNVQITSADSTLDPGRNDGQNTGQSSTVQDIVAEIADPSIFEQSDFSFSDLPQDDCYMDARLYIADGPGKPKKNTHEQLQVTALISPKSFFAYSAGSIMPVWPIEPIKPILPIEPINPNPTPMPLSDIAILSPVAGEILTAGSNYMIEWEIYNGRELAVNLLFSSDGGESFKELASGLPNNGFYQITVPAKISTACLIRLEAWRGTQFIGYNVSSLFSIVNPIAPSPIPSVTPMPSVKPMPSVTPTPTPTPPVNPSPPPAVSPTPTTVPETEPTPKPDLGQEQKYIDYNGSFISSEGDPLRWFKVEHNLADTDHMVWQAARTPFPCGYEAPQDKPPGLLAEGILPESTTEFSVDFNALVNRLQKNAVEAPDIANKGSTFEKVSDVYLLPQSQYVLYIRVIIAEEICFYIKNSKTGDFLYPYDLHMYMYPQTTREQYQATVDRMLPPGASFHLTVKASAWDEFWSDFFSLLSEIYSNIQKQYNGLKYSVANFIADRFAFMGDDFQDFTRTAVVGLIDYGLASVGLPPSLPNFEEMADQGLDYCVRIALEEAAQASGIPVSEIPEETRFEIRNKVKDSLKDLTYQKNVNPLDVNYLKPSVKAMYRPAYVDVKFFNQHGQISPTGTLTISYYPKDKPHFKLYNYVSLPIPSLKPHESTFMRVYLKPDNTDLSVWKEYYNGDVRECSFNFNVSYNVPDPKTAAQQQGISGADKISPENFYYDIDPIISYSKITVPNEAFYNLYD